MGWLYLLILFGGALFGAILMMVAFRKEKPHVVHVFCDKNGIAQIMTFPKGDEVIWHRDDIRSEGRKDDITVERKLEDYDKLLESGIPSSIIRSFFKVNMEEKNDV